MILVTAAGSKTGRLVIAALAGRGLACRAGVRRPDGPGAVRLDLADPATWPGALDGAAGVFLLRPPALAAMGRTLVPFVDAVRARGAGPIVFLSVAGAENNRLLPHAAVERHLIAGPRDWTLLRPGYFAQNLEDAFLADIRDAGRIALPAGAGRVAFVDLRDVAEVAADAFADPGRHAGAAWTLTGPRAVGFAEVAQLLSEAAGRPIAYRRMTPLAYAAHLARSGMPAMQVLVQTVLNTGLRFGQAERVDPALPRLLGRPATDIADYIRDHADLWRRRS
ncbi:MAG: NAD(P)H-binding protein [Gemmobacter sp.]